MIHSFDRGSGLGAALEKGAEFSRTSAQTLDSKYRPLRTDKAVWEVNSQFKCTGGLKSSTPHDDVLPLYCTNRSGAINNNPARLCLGRRLFYLKPSEKTGHCRATDGDDAKPLHAPSATGGRQW